MLIIYRLLRRLDGKCLWGERSDFVAPREEQRWQGCVEKSSHGTTIIQLIDELHWWTAQKVSNTEQGDESWD